MDTKRPVLLMLSMALLASASARADDDEEGRRKTKRPREVHHHHYYQGCPPPAARAELRPLAAAPGFPRESASERGSARQRQREILLKELATEEQLLEHARRGSMDGGTIEQHQRNVDALRRELGGALR